MTVQLDATESPFGELRSKDRLGKRRSVDVDVHLFMWAIKNTPIPSHEILVGWKRFSQSYGAHHNPQ